MRKILVVMFALISVNAFAAVGLGFNYISDYWKADELLSKDVPVSQGIAKLSREAMANPSGIGAFVVLGAGKFEAQVDAEYVTKKYSISLLRNPTVGSSQVDNLNMKSTRYGLSATLKYKFFSIPAVAVYGGAGVGAQVQSPVAGVELVKDVIATANEKLTISSAELLRKSNKLGYHVLVQTRIKPPAVPLGLQVTLRGLILPESTFDKPSFVPNLMIGLGYYPL